MQNKKPLYQPWDEEAFLADLRVRGMTPVQRWMYRCLLQSAFVCSTRPYLPDDDNQLWVLAGAESKAQWLENREIILSTCFTPADEIAPMFRNKRVSEDWQNLLDVRARMAELGAKGGSVKRAFSGGLAHAKQVSKGSKISKVREDKGREVRPALSSSELADKWSD